MSWSVGAKGITPEVGEIIEKQFNDGGKCVEPEESTRQTARRLIAQMVEVQTPGTKLNISAYGSQSFDWPIKPGHSVSMGIKIDVEA